jgi:hypothetical protein
VVFASEAALGAAMQAAAPEAIVSDAKAHRLEDGPSFDMISWALSFKLGLSFDDVAGAQLAAPEPAAKAQPAEPAVSMMQPVSVPSEVPPTLWPRNRPAPPPPSPAKDSGSVAQDGSGKLDWKEAVRARRRQIHRLG